MSYIPKDAVTQAFQSNKGVLTPNQIIELDNQNKFTKYGQLEFIETATVSSTVSTISLDNLNGTEYDVHFVTYVNVVPETDNRHIRIRFKVDGSTVTANDYKYAQFRNTASTGDNLKANNDSKIWLAYNCGSASGETLNGHFYMYNANDGSKYTYTEGRAIHINKDSNQSTNFHRGVSDATTVIDGIEFGTSGDGIQSGTFSIYGIRYS